MNQNMNMKQSVFCLHHKPLARAKFAKICVIFDINSGDKLVTARTIALYFNAVAQTQYETCLFEIVMMKIYGMQYASCKTILHKNVTSLNTLVQFYLRF